MTRAHKQAKLTKVGAIVLRCDNAVIMMNVDGCTRLVSVPEIRRRHLGIVLLLAAAATPIFTSGT